MNKTRKIKSKVPHPNEMNIETPIFSSPKTPVAQITRNEEKAQN